MNILGIQYLNVTRAAAVTAVLKQLESGKKSSLFFLNIQCLRCSTEDNAYRQALLGGTLILPDGVGMKIMTRCFGGRMVEDCNGTDFSPLLFEKLAAQKRKVFLLGARPGRSALAADVLQKRFPGLEVVGTHHGFFEDDDGVINEINQTGAEILVVGMGVPRQEKWIHQHQAALDVTLCMGVGALIDYISGQLPRAPLFMRKLHLEWLWRIFIDPKRMVKRYLLDGIPFLISSFFGQTKK